MAPQRSLLQCFCSLLVLVGVAHALKFDMAAQPESSKRERCIRNFVSENELVVVTATVDGYRGDGMMLNIHVRLAPC